MYKLGNQHPTIVVCRHQSNKTFGAFSVINKTYLILILYFSSNVIQEVKIMNVNGKYISMIVKMSRKSLRNLW